MTSGQQHMTIQHYFAISSIGWGKGFTPEDAVNVYVTTQLRNHPAKNTVFGTKKKWEQALREGEAKPDVWLPPAGTTGFVIDDRGLHWLDEGDNYTPAELEHKVAAEPVSETSDTGA